eukprot:TRINITY_DN3121_c0_g1_i2.p1 TRINITY_DN3121_c0_g1~~TRINITY_DN3121_c0_g1_i2.p1  ORF type:complete len:469 (+),score=70.31 TRINITY_DN3121_c0_g1_i2:39-1409(+)
MGTKELNWMKMIGKGNEGNETLVVAMTIKDVVCAGPEAKAELSSVAQQEVVKDFVCQVFVDNEKVDVIISKEGQRKGFARVSRNNSFVTLIFKAADQIKILGSVAFEVRDFYECKELGDFSQKVKLTQLKQDKAVTEIPEITRVFLDFSITEPKKPTVAPLTGRSEGKQDVGNQSARKHPEQEIKIELDPWKNTQMEKLTPHSYLCTQTIREGSSKKVSLLEKLKEIELASVRLSYEVRDGGPASKLKPSVSDIVSQIRGFREEFEEYLMQDTIRMEPRVNDEPASCLIMDQTRFNITSDEIEDVRKKPTLTAKEKSLAKSDVESYGMTVFEHISDLSDLSPQQTTEKKLNVTIDPVDQALEQFWKLNNLENISYEKLMHQVYQIDSYAIGLRIDGRDQLVATVNGESCLLKEFLQNHLGVNCGGVVTKRGLESGKVYKTNQFVSNPVNFTSFGHS